jgi:elongation factor P hydroxylase
MPCRPTRPARSFSWDGERLSVATEAYVLLHEIAHFQLASPERRHIVDFALGAGPETGERRAADHAQRVFGLEREEEEAMASLLGILWEAELGHPALASFLDQNWLEGAECPAAAAHFRRVLGRLEEGGFVDRHGRPTMRVRTTPDRAVEAA